MLSINPQIQIPDAELVERFVRASGPGGQNVNKVSTAVELRFDAAASLALPEPVRARLLARRDQRITDAGLIIIQASRFRTQDRNRQDARERLAGLILAATLVPKKRIATKPSRGAKERRMEGKRVRSGIKSTRGNKAWDPE
jgi:ribosome-associated protein